MRFLELRLSARFAAAAIACASFSVSYTQSFAGLSIVTLLAEAWIRRRESRRIWTLPAPFLCGGLLFSWLIVDWFLSTPHLAFASIAKSEAADLFLWLFGLAVFWTLRQDSRNQATILKGFLVFAVVMTFFGCASLFTEHRLARFFYGKGFLAVSETRPQHLFGVFAGIPLYRPIGLLNNRLTFACLLVLAAPALLFLYREQKSRLALLLLVLTPVLLIVNGTRSALAGAGIACGWLLLRIPGRFRAGAAALAFLLSLAFAAGLTLRQTDFQRPVVWSAALDIFLDAPLTGSGPGQFSSAFEEWKNHASLAMPEAWYFLEITPHGHAHNDLLHLLAAGGIPAGLLFLALCGTALRSNTGRAGMVLAGIAGFFAAGLAQCYFQDDETVVLFWALLGLSEHLRISPQENELRGRSQASPRSENQQSFSPQGPLLSLRAPCVQETG